jgi:hypothetical protein
MRIPKVRAERLQLLRGVEQGHPLSRRNPLKFGLGLRM